MNTKKSKKRIAALLLVCLMLCLHVTAFADWNFPYTELTAESGIVMDADTGGILFGKDMHAHKYPASITKVLTALVVLEHYKPTDEVTLTHDDVYNVDFGSSNAQLEEGDTLTVEDLLNAMLLKSANEAANALACYVAGSREAFADLMNETAIALGCVDSHFTNPSGLFDENHYTSAYDMALIGAEAMKNQDFLEVESHMSYKMPATIRLPEGSTVYMEHKMLRPDNQYSDSRVVAGKTGYTVDCGNTLITMAESDGRRLVAVVLKDKNPQHYLDTEALLNLGFDETENLPVPDGMVSLDEIRSRLVADTIISDEPKTSDLHFSSDMLVSLPKGSSTDGITWDLQYNLPKGVSEDTVAEVRFYAGDLEIGKYYVEKEQSIRVQFEEAPTTTKVAVAASVSFVTVALIIAAIFFSGGLTLGLKNVHDDHKLKKKMQDRRRQRLQDMNMSEEEFKQLVDARKNRKNNSEINSSL